MKYRIVLTLALLLVLGALAFFTIVGDSGSISAPVPTSDDSAMKNLKFN
jgi:hypothetical protein